MLGSRPAHTALGVLEDTISSGSTTPSQSQSQLPFGATVVEVVVAGAPATAVQLPSHRVRPRATQAPIPEVQSPPSTSSVRPLQSLSAPSQVSTSEGLAAAFVSSQSPMSSAYPAGIVHAARVIPATPYPSRS